MNNIPKIRIFMLIKDTADIIKSLKWTRTGQFHQWALNTLNTPDNWFLDTYQTKRLCSWWSTDIQTNVCSVIWNRRQRQRARSLQVAKLVVNHNHRLAYSSRQLTKAPTEPSWLSRSRRVWPWWWHQTRIMIMVSRFSLLFWVPLIKLLGFKWFRRRTSFGSSSTIVRTDNLM